MGTRMLTLTPMTTAGQDGSSRIVSLGAVLTVGKDAQQSASTSTSPVPFPAPNTPQNELSCSLHSQGEESRVGRSNQKAASPPLPSPHRHTAVHVASRGCRRPCEGTRASPTHRAPRTPSFQVAGAAGLRFSRLSHFWRLPRARGFGTLCISHSEPPRLGSWAGGTFLLKIITTERKKKKKKRLPVT